MHDLCSLQYHLQTLPDLVAIPDTFATLINLTWPTWPGSECAHHLASPFRHLLIDLPPLHSTPRLHSSSDNALIAMTATIPSGDPPPHLLAKALSYLAMEVGKAAPLGPSSLVPILSRYLSLLARHRTSAPLGPLHAFSSLCAEAPEYVTVPLACDAVLAYPAEVGVLDSALSNVKVDFDALVRRLPSRLSRQGVRLAHGLLRLRTTENVVVKHSQDLVRAMVRAYPQASAGEKGEMLVLARALVGKDAELRKLLTNEGPKGVPLLSQSMGRDYADLFEARLPLPEAQAVSVRDAHDAERSTDPVSYKRLGVS